MPIASKLNLHTIRINRKSGGNSKNIEIFLDGMKLKAVRSFNYTVGIKQLGVATIEFYADMVSGTPEPPEAEGKDWVKDLETI